MRAATSPIAPRCADRLRSPWGPCTRSREHDRGLLAGPPPRRERARVRCLAHRRRHPGARSRRRARLPVAPAADRPGARHRAPAHIPSLAQLVSECGAGFHLSLDLKDSSAGPVVIEVLSASAPELLDRTWLCHPDAELLAELRTVSASVRLLQSTRLSRIGEGPERRAASLARLGLDGINLHHSDGTVDWLRCSIASDWWPSGGICSSNTSCDLPCEWGSTRSTATTSMSWSTPTAPRSAHPVCPEGADRSQPLPVGARPEHHERPTDQLVVCDRTERSTVLRA
jgi:hypothetical protein